MKLVKFEVHNFKNLHNVSFSWDDIIVLIGENNAGKSTVMQALGCYLSGKPNRDCLRNGEVGEQNAIELVGHFTDLTPFERHNPAVQNKMLDSHWILKKRFWLTHDSDSWQESYEIYCEDHVYAGWPESESKWDNWPGDYQTLIHAVKAELNTSRVTIDGKERLKQLVLTQRPDLVSQRLDWVKNEGGSKGWKTHANAILPQFISVQAVQEAASAAQAKGTSTYGQLFDLMLKKRLGRHPELKALQEQVESVRRLIGVRDESDKADKAPEIRDFENDITRLLDEVITAQASISVNDIDISDILLPNTVLRLDDGFTTTVEHKGHGLQRTLIVALLQLLVEYETPARKQIVPDIGEGEHTESTRPVIFAIEEPELYMHPQMERKMRDALYRLAATDNYQVICTTHSPVFLDMAEKHTAIVRLVRPNGGEVEARQVTADLFSGDDAQENKKLLRMIAEFDPAVNEVFFAKRVVLVEGDTEIAVFNKAADLLNLFQGKTQDKRDTTFVNCHGKWTIPLFQQVLNHFQIDYTVFHDEDTGKNMPFKANAIIGGLVKETSRRHMFTPDLEGVLGYKAGHKDKPFTALRELETRHRQNQLPPEFIRLICAAWSMELPQAQQEAVAN